MKKLAVDPYSFNTSSFFNKEEEVDRNVSTLIWLFNKSENQIFNTSKSYEGRELFLFRFIISSKFYENAMKYQLTKNSTNLSSLIAIFAIEGWVTAKHKINNCDRLVSFLTDCLSVEDKIRLLSGYTFGVQSGLMSGKPRSKHLVYRAAILDPDLKQYQGSYCSTGDNPICACKEWLNKTSTTKINKYIKILGVYLYQMRNAVCHEGSYTGFVVIPEKGVSGFEIPTTLVDTITKTRQNADNFISYSTSVTKQDLHYIIRNGAWNLFGKGSNVRTYKNPKLFKRL